MRSILLCLLAVFVLTACHKDREAVPAPRAFDVVHIDSVRVLQWTADTIAVPLSDLTGHFSPPVHEMYLPHIEAQVLDSLQLAIEKRDHISWNRPALPALTVSVPGQDTPLKLFPDHGMRVDAYQVGGIFPAHTEPQAYFYSTVGTTINGYVVERHYDRIVFFAALLLYVRGPDGDTAALRGQVDGSQAGQEYYSFHSY